MKLADEGGGRYQSSQLMVIGRAGKSMVMDPSVSQLAGDDTTTAGVSHKEPPRRLQALAGVMASLRWISKKERKQFLGRGPALSQALVWIGNEGGNTGEERRWVGMLDFY